MGKSIIAKDAKVAERRENSDPQIKKIRKILGEEKTRTGGATMSRAAGVVPFSPSQSS
jgi:hypothetical protein